MPKLKDIAGYTPPAPTDVDDRVTDQLAGAPAAATLTKAATAEPEQAKEDTHDTPEAPAPAEAPKKPAEAKKKPRRGPADTPKNGVNRSKFAKLSEAKDFVNVLYYGKEGTGKTTAAVTASHNGPVLIVNSEGGLKPQALAEAGANIDNVYLYPAHPGEPVTIEGLRDTVTTVKSDLMDDPDAWYAVIVDSVTDVAQSILDQVSTSRVEKTVNRGVHVDTIDEFFTDRSDYGTMSKVLRSVFRELRNLPVHWISTALERRDVDEDTGKVAYNPAVSPALAVDLLGYVDVVLPTRKPDDRIDAFRSSVKSGTAYRSKDRYHRLPELLINPTFERVRQYIEGELVEDKDPVQNIDQYMPKKRTTK